MTEKVLDKLAKARGAKNWEHYIWRQQDAMSDICFDTQEELEELLFDAIKENKLVPVCLKSESVSLVWLEKHCKENSFDASKSLVATKNLNELMRTILTPSTEWRRMVSAYQLIRDAKKEAGK